MVIHIATAGDDDEARRAGALFRELAARDRVGVHTASADAEVADAILFVDMFGHGVERYLVAHRSHPLTRRYPGKIFAYNALDQPLFVFRGIYPGGNPRLASRVRGMVGGPYARLCDPVPATAAPSLLFSFVGSRTHPLRDRVLALRHPRGRVSDTTERFGYGLHGTDTAGAEQLHRQLTADSKFVLCPRGFGPSSMRIFETLRAGAVPVIIGDDWLPPPRVDWASCSIRVAEADIGAVGAILETHEDRWPELAVAARRVGADEFADDALWHHFASSISALSSVRRRRRPWWAQRSVIRSKLRER